MCGVFRRVPQPGRARGVPVFPCFSQEVSSSAFLGGYQTDNWTADSILVNMHACIIKLQSNEKTQIGHHAANFVDSYVVCEREDANKQYKQ